MHEFDPNGSIHEYRIWRERKHRIFDCLLGAAVVAALILGTGLAFIALAILQNGN